MRVGALKSRTRQQNDVSCVKVRLNVIKGDRGLVLSCSSGSCHHLCLELSSVPMSLRERRLHARLNRVSAKARASVLRATYEGFMLSCYLGLTASASRNSKTPEDRYRSTSLRISSCQD